MALPLKSGADLYNQQLIRAAVWNYSADGLEPGEYATGLIYFNTNPNSNMFQKLRFRTATDWKTIAFAEDLDVATNKDFKALKEKVELLSGEVDTDAIINNMKEVTAFLSGFAEDANLMSVLDGKLDKAGGTITGNGEVPLKINTTGNTSRIAFSNSDTLWGYLGFKGIDEPAFISREGSRFSLLHSGNVGDYALKIDGSNRMTGDLKLLVKESGSLNVGASDGLFIYRGPNSGGGDAGFPGNYKNVLNIGALYSNMQLAWLRSTSEVYLAMRTGQNNSYSDWRTIAFTDSNVASATKLQTKRKLWGNDFDGTADISGNLILNNQSAIQSYTTSGKGLELFNISSNNNLSIGYSMAGVGDSYIYGNAIYLRYGSSRTNGLILNSSGNVGIGTVYPEHRLHVSGTFKVSGIASLASRVLIGNGVVDDGLNSLQVGGSICTNYALYTGGKKAYNDAVKGAFIGSDGTIHLAAASAPAIYFHYGLSDSHTSYMYGTSNGMQIGDVVNVTKRLNINGATDNENYALNVNGIFHVNNDIVIKKTTSSSSTLIFENHRIGSGGHADTLFSVRDAAGTKYGGIGLFGDTTPKYYYFGFGSYNSASVLRVYANGHVGLGTEDNGYKLDVNGTARISGDTTIKNNLAVNKDIVANGTIACKGVAAVGDIAGMGTVDKWIGMVDKTTNSQVYTHGLNTEDVTVSIYEKNGSEWVLVLTDVDIVDQNRIRVMFGTTPTIDHKIVVMG